MGCDVLQVGMWVITALKFKFEAGIHYYSVIKMDLGHCFTI